MLESYQLGLVMNELAVFVPSSFNFNILELWFQDGEEIAYVFGSLSGLFLPLFVFNKKGEKRTAL